MSENVVVIHPNALYAKSGENAHKAQRDPDAALAEAVGLVHAIALNVVHDESVRVQKVTPATLFGKGTVERLRDVIKAEEASLVFINDALTPIQQRNLEKEWNCKVIDRTGMILEIFGARARTHEGRLQVELAAR